MGQSKWQRLAGSTGGKSQPLVQIAFTRDSKRLVTPGTDHTIKIWDTATGNELTTLHYESQTEDKKEIKLMAVTFSANERELYAIGDNWSIFRSPVSLDDVIAEAKKRLQPQK